MLINKSMLRQRVILEQSEFTSWENRIVDNNKRLHNKMDKYDLFLSHSYLDKELVYSLVNLFNDSGYSVYVDWMVDKQLDRTNVNAKTADLLRLRMEMCNGLAFVSTSNIIQSKWCPWELGYVDGKKNGRCAILPVLETSSGSFKGQEYLGLYPFIDYASFQGNNKYEFWVNDPDDNNKYVSLREWLEGTDPFCHK